MAVALTVPDNDSVVQYSVSGASTGPFTIDFAYFDEDDIVVVETDANGVHTTYVKTTDYTISGTSVEGGFSGGSVTLVSSVSNVTITIYRDLAVARSANWVAGGFDVDDLNTEQNKIFAILQQFERDINRAVRRHIADTASSLILPLLADRASKFFSFDASSEPETLTVSDISGLSEYAQKYQVAASEPSTRANGTALQSGDIWYDTSADQWKIYDGSSYNVGPSLVSPFGTSDINDDAITLAKMAGLTRGSIIYGNSSGDPAALAIGAADRVLKSDGTDLAYGQLTAGMFPNDIVTLAMMASGTAGKVIGFDNSGDPAEITPVFTESFTSSEIAVATGDQVYTASHSLSGIPKLVQAYIVCKTTDKNWSVGDEVMMSDQIKPSTGGIWAGTVPFKNSTQCGLVQERDIYIPDKSSGLPTKITYANWRLKFYAFY